MNNVTQKIKALRAARRLLVNGDEDFICIALYTVEERNRSLKEACYHLRDYVHKALGAGTITLCTWQDKNGFVRDESTKSRIAWIDWMIGCYQGEH